MDQSLPLKGQKALVTGANSGIGEGVALSLAEAGADVVINFRSHEDKALEIVNTIKKMGRESYCHQADVSKEDEVIGMFDKMIQSFGGIDILVNNAGLQKDSPFEQMTLEAWNLVLGINLTGQFLCARQAIREFKKRGIREDVSKSLGKIICMSSVHERIPWAGHANYATSKGGIMMMMKSLSQEFAHEKIRVNSICPGAIKTPINKEAWETKEALDDLLELIPYKRIGDTSDIGKAAVWLASDASEYVNGISLFVDGGMTLYPGFTTGG